MVELILFATGLCSFTIGIYRLLGPVSVTYLHRGGRVKGGNYLALPYSLTMFLWALALSPYISSDETQYNLMVAGCLVIVISIYPAYKYLKPKWLYWLERNHKAIIPELQLEIERTGQVDWNKRINTQEELEAWVDTYLAWRYPDKVGSDKESG